MGLTIAQKILKMAAGEAEPRPGDILISRASIVMISEALGPTFFDHEFQSLGGVLFDPKRVVGIIDHYSPAATIKQADLNCFTRDWFRKHLAKNLYYDCGPNPQVMAEQGFFQPGTLVVGNDSHTSTGGAFGAFAFGIGSSATACAAATGKVWVRVPETIKVTLNGNLPPMVSGKDVALFLLGKIGPTKAIYRVLEFSGSCIRNLSMDDRMVISNMSTEMGAKAGIMAPDEKTRRAVGARSEFGFWDLCANPGAAYMEELIFGVDGLTPLIAVPHHIGNVVPVSDTAGLKIHQAFIGSCTGGRYTDLEVTVKILRGKRVHPNVRLIVSPASKWIWERAAREGILLELSEAGAIIANPSCGPCGGAQGGLIGSGEVCIAASNRNFKGRMGSTEAEVYVASPATVAASAVEGQITDPRTMRGKEQ